MEQVLADADSEGCGRVPPPKPSVVSPHDVENGQGLCIIGVVLRPGRRSPLNMKRPIELGIAIAIALLSPAQPAQETPVDGVPHYRLLQVVELSTVQEKVSETAAEGYRMVGAAPAPGGTWAAIMERVEAPSKPYKYLLLGRKGDSDFQGQINAAASQGFRLLPRYVAQGLTSPPQFDVAWMERPAVVPAATQYMLVPFGAKMAAKAGLNPALWADTNPLHYIRPQINDALRQGYRIERVVSGAVVVMERSAASAGEGGDANSPGSNPDLLSRYHTLGHHPAGKLQKRLQQEALRGYHLLDFSPYAPLMWVAAVLEKDGNEPSASGGARYDYTAFAGELPELEKDLNSHAAGGYRLFPQSLLGTLHPQPHPAKPPRCTAVMEKAPGGLGRFQYRVLSAPRLSDLSADLEKAAGEGFRGLGIMSFDDRLAVVLEKPGM